MNRTIRPAPVRKSVFVSLPPDRAFDVFTARMGRWWHREHHLGSAPLADVVVEPRTGGRWYERGEDGGECDWGRVLAWEPPARVLLAWQLNAEWRYDPDFVTELEVTFTAEAGGTRVALEHRNLERYGEAAGTVRTSLDSPNGWTLLMDGFAREAAA